MLVKLFIMRCFLLIVTLIISSLTFSQTKKIAVNNHEFTIKTSFKKNDLETIDTIQKLYRGDKFVLKFYKFHYEGGDCNNLFWNKETLEVKNDSLVFMTHYFQKTGLDPIPEFRKQIYKVGNKGRLKLVYDKYKYKNSNIWRDN